MAQTSGMRRYGETRRVLVVEDDFDSAEALCTLVQQAGHDCQVALSATEARAITQEFLPEVALIDIGLPRESAYELVRHLKRQSSLVGCRFVAITGHRGAQVPEQSSEAGFEAHLTKPVARELLLGVLDLCGATAERVRPAS